MVRLKDESRERQAQRALFRFQNGSIKSVREASVEIDYLQFRFQNGSIKSQYLIIDVAFVVRFDSKMVRLKVRHTRWVSSLRRCFDSKMVRLKERARC